MIERVEVDEKQVARLVSALRAEDDGKKLNHDLVEGLKKAVEPAAAAARASILSMATSGLHHTEPGLRSVVANETKVSVRVGGQHPRVAIVVAKHGMPRDFSNAPKRLNAKRGWRHRVFGSDNWVTQRGKPGWFDDTIKAFLPAAKDEAEKALDSVAERIAYKTKG